MTMTMTELAIGVAKVQADLDAYKLKRHLEMVNNNKVKLKGLAAAQFKLLELQLMQELEKQLKSKLKIRALLDDLDGLVF